MKQPELTIAIPPRERPCFRRRPRMSPSFCFAFSTTATAISTTLVDFLSAHPLPLRTIQRPSFFGLDAAEWERWAEEPLWIFFPYRESIRSSPHPSARNVLRAATTPGGGPKKIQPPICKVGGLFNCDIQFLLAIHLFPLPFSAQFFSLFLSFVLSSLSFAVFKASRWFIRAARSLIFRDVFFSSFFFYHFEMRRRLGRE